MWKHPRYAELTGKAPAEARTAEAPAPTGELLASFPRKGPDGVEQQLRVVLDEYQGHRYIAVRLWQADRDGGWWPIKGKGVSIRLSEAEGVADALRMALGQAVQLARAGNIASETISFAKDNVPSTQRPAREAPRRRGQRPGGRADWDRDGIAGKPAVNLGDQDVY